MRGTMPFTCTMESICVNHFRAKFTQNSHELRIHNGFTCVVACGCECEFRAKFMQI